MNAYRPRGDSPQRNNTAGGGVGGAETVIWKKKKHVRRLVQNGAGAPRRVVGVRIQGADVGSARHRPAGRTPLLQI